MKRILQELKKINTENDDELFIIAETDNYFQISAMFKGPDDSPYEGYYFKILMEIPVSYPISPMHAKFVTKVFHPNVNMDSGEICIDILKKEWTPAWGIQNVCHAIRSLLGKPDPDSPLNVLAGNLARADEIGFYTTAKMFSEEFADKTNVLMEKNKKS